MGQLSSGAFDGTGTGTFSGSRVRTLRYLYDFAKQGGAVSTIAIGTIPAGTVILGGWLNVLTAAAGGGSIGIDSEATSDLVASAAASGAPWSTTGKKAILPKRNTPETSSITTTQSRDIVVNITTTPLTGGKWELILEVL